MKPTKEEILNKHLNKLPPEYVTYIPKRERDARQYTLDAMQEYAEAFHKEKIGDTSIDALDFVHQWFYKLSIGQTTQGEVADAIEQFHKEKLREELIEYDLYHGNKDIFQIEKWVDEYLKTLNTK